MLRTHEKHCLANALTDVNLFADGQQGNKLDIKDQAHLEILPKRLEYWTVLSISVNVHQTHQRSA